MPGPPPKHPSERRRRNATVAMTQLPSEGRKGRAPHWPLPPNARLQSLLNSAEASRDLVAEQIEAGSVDKSAAAKLARLEHRIAVLELEIKTSSKMERALWKELWATPQAVAWERMRWTREVAQYVRWKCLAELGDIDASKEARQLADRLGLNPTAMLKLRWEVVEDEVAQKRSEEQADGLASVRRIHAVDAAANE